MNPAVTEYIGNIDHGWQVDICNRVREVIHQSIPDVEEQVKYRQAFYTKNGKQICVFFPAKAWVNVTIFNAGTLEAPAGLFEPGDNPDRKAIKIRDGRDFDYELLAQLFQDATQA